MKNRFIYIAMILLLVSEGFMFWKNKQQKREIQLKNNDIELLSTYGNTMENAFSTTIRNAGVQIESNIVTQDTTNGSKTLHEIANQIDGNMLVFRYSDRMCNECVEHTLRIFADHKDYMDKSRIVFLANNTSPRALKINKNEYGLQDCRVLNCPNLGIPAEEAMFPYIMVIDSSLRVLSVYFPNKSTRGTDYDYKHVKYMYDKLIKEN